MAEGEVVKQEFFKVFSLPEARKKPPLPASVLSKKECCFSLPALADDTGNDATNDKHTILARYDASLYADVTIFLQKYENGAWVDKVELIDDSFGINYSFGTITDSEEIFNYVAYTIHWDLVRNFYNDGTYRFRFKEVDTSATETESFYLFEFCLKEYLGHRANGTTRFTWYTKGYRGDAFEDTEIWDFVKAAEEVGGEGWFNQMRLPDSIFGSNKSEYEREYVKYSNGQQVWLKDEQTESYTWFSGQYPAQLHDYIKTEIIQADRILVTDYNTNNPNIIDNKAVNPNSNYEPQWQYNNLKALVEVEFVQEYQNRRKLRC